MNPVNRKQAPQQTVVSISRYGQWGKVEYAHKLDCGHTEIRKRATRAPKIACEQCVKANTAKQMLSTFVPAPRIDDDLTWQDEIASSIAKVELDVITEETIAGTEISYVLIVLDAAQAAYLSDSQNQ